MFIKFSINVFFFFYCLEKLFATRQFVSYIKIKNINFETDKSLYFIFVLIRIKKMFKTTKTKYIKIKVFLENELLD